MFQDVDLNDDIDTILDILNKNNSRSLEVRKQISSLRINIEEDVEYELDLPNEEASEKEERHVRDREDNLENYINLYHNASADIEELEGILPDKDDYKYRDILLRLCAESLKDIKEMTEMSHEDGTYEDKDVQAFIQNEYDKIDVLQLLINPEIDDLGEIETSNKLFLVPNRNGKIRVLEDLDHIPSEHYDEIYDLIMSIINGTFKSVKKLTKSSNSQLHGVCEVKSSLGRVMFKRLNHDTYAIITTFLKKTKNDRGYQNYIRTRIGDYIQHEDEYKKMLDDPEYMILNDFYVEELFNKLGRTREKEYKKVISND